MAQYDDKLNRMLNLMEDDRKSKNIYEGNVWYHANGADGKVYGILKEGTKFYIKTTESGKENISESYDYINGFTNRREHEYSSYNDATKHLEQELMYLNEQFGKHEPTSTVDFKRTEKSFAFLTEESRKELDRMNQIYENSCKIGMNCIGDPESKGKSTGDNTTKNNDPFTEKANATLDKDLKAEGTVENATENKEVTNVEKDLQSDKMKTANSGSEKDYKDAHDDLDGEGVADKKINEGICELGDDLDVNNFEEPEDVESTDDVEDLNLDNFEDPSVEDGVEEPFNEFGEEEPLDIDNEVGDDIAGSGDESLDELLEDFEKKYGVADTHNATKSVITGPESVMDKEDNSINGTNNGVDDEKGEDWKRIDEDGNVNEPAKQGNEDTMKNYQAKGNLPVQSWDKLNEAIDAVVENVYNKLTTKKETLQEAIERIVKEEITRLDVWGKHPRYQQEPMTTPDNKEVLAGTAEKDWNDDSAKGGQAYGKKIGKGDPYTEKVVNMLTDQVMANLKENFR